MTDFLRVDLHVHSSRSPDSRLSLEAIATQLPYAGLKGFALTDHNTTAGLAELPRLRERFPGALIVPGVEVSTREGHLLAYGVSECPPVHRPVLETIDWVRDHGGEPVVAHPFRLAHGVGRRVASEVPVHVVEVRNGHNSELQNLKAELVAAQRGLGGSGGSDAHELRDLGRAYTEFPDEVGSVDDVLERLRRGVTSAGGHSLRLSGRLRLSVRTGLLRLGRGLRPL
jgi:predicted metal-dependent phosphoesterase TrpH